MSAAYLHTCRFCGELARGDEGIRYGVRHFAHFECYLSAGKSLADLTPWKVGQFPYRTLKAHGLVAIADEIAEGEEMKAQMAGGVR